MSINIAVIGPGEEATPEDIQDALAVGAAIARRGGVVITGGLGGVMRAATDGAVDAKGVAVALLPGDDMSSIQLNPRATIHLPTGIGEMRNGLLVRGAHAVISIGCSWGTMNEIALAIRLAKQLTSIRPWDVRLPDGRLLNTMRASSPLEAVSTVFTKIEG